MKARADGECACGFPQIYKDVTHVRYERQRVVACEECEPELANEPENDEATLRSVRVKIVGTKYQKDDEGSWCVHVSELDMKPEPWMPEEIKNAKWARPLAVVGPTGPLLKGAVVSILGRFVHDGRHGLQFLAVARAQPALDSDSGLLHFLEKLPNIGRARATAILQHFGTREKVIEALDSDQCAAMMSVISGITAERGADIKEAYSKLAEYREFAMFAASIGLAEHIVASAVDEWGQDARTVIEEDAYALMELPRVGFKTADEAHAKLRGDPKSPNRCSAGVKHALEALTGEGHAFSSRDEIQNYKPRGDITLGFTEEEVESGLQILEKERTKKLRDGRIKTVPPFVVRDGASIYLKDVYDAERSIPYELRRIETGDLRTVQASTALWGERKPAREQALAVDLACNAPIMVMTGGPGVGKTATTKVIIDAFEGSGLDVVLCAPTGKAAKRLTELTGHEASTIHRLVGYDKTSSNRLQIEADCIIVDELSMVGLELFARLLKAVRTGTRLIMVGDVDQLPSIDAGRVLADLIEAERVPTVRLTEIFRQASGDAKRIPDVARDINQGRCPDLMLKGTDVNFSPLDVAEDIRDAVVRVVSELLPKKYGWSSDDIQVIAPQKGEQGKANEAIGVRGLNEALQAALNPAIGSPEMHIGEYYKMRANDRVMQTSNNYNLEVMNGEQGRVLRVSTTPFIPDAHVITSARTKAADKIADEEVEQEEWPPVRSADNIISMTRNEKRTSSPSKPEKPSTVAIIDYGDGRIVGYTKDELRELHLAYALTVHKTQGSQYKAVVMVVHKLNAFMLTRALLYTGLTRAEQYALFIGQEQAVARAVRNIRGTVRRSALQERLKSPMVIDAMAQPAVEDLRPFDLSGDV